MRLLDRYLIRETLTPFLLALAVSTFIFQINPILEKAEFLLAKGVPAPTVGYLLLTLLPQALGVTLPIAFLIGLLMALGRISGDRESVAILACGVSPLRLLRPIALMAIVIGAANLYVMTTLVPDANQSFREVTFRFLAKQSEADIKPRLFYEGFPNKVLYIRETNPGGGWSGVLVADTSTQSGRPTVTLAESGVLSLDEQKRDVNLFLRGVFHYEPGATGDEYQVTRAETYRFSIPASSVFGAGDTPISRGNPERKIPDLLAEIDNKRQAGLSPHNEIMYLHQMFSFPVACLVFAPIGLALGLHTRREGKLAGLTLGMIVVFVYWGLMALAESLTKGQHFPAEWSRWVPNLALAPLGIAALWWRSRARGREIRIPVPALPSFLRQPSEAPSGGKAAATAPRVVVVIKIPHLELPRPRLLDAYIAGKYLRMIALAAIGLLGLYYIAEFLDKSEKLFKGQADGALMLEYLWYSTPRFLAFIVPIATLLGVLGTIGTLTRTGELTVMRACGISLYRAALPLFTLALVWSGVLFFLDDRVIAKATQKAEVLDDQIRGNAPRTVNVLVNRHWLAAEDGRIYHYLAYQRQRLYGLSVFATQAPPYRLASHTYASRAEYRDSGWEAESGWIQRFPAIDRSEREAIKQRPLDLKQPDFFENAQVDAAAMTFGELRTYIQQQHASGFSLADERVSLHKKIAFPAVTLVMTLLAVPFAVTTGRRGALYGIGLAIILAIAYFLLTAVFSAAGKATVLPPMLAAWAPNLFFVIAAAYLMLRVRT
jgi:LPS export ABC transporter permease LptG/LPS export ABC transporter permease LptF